MLRIIVLFLLTTSIAFADGKGYWSIRIPDMKGATAATHEKDKKFYIISTSYELSVHDINRVYDFYNKFFDSMGWKDPMTGQRNLMRNLQGKWSTFNSGFKKGSGPYITYAAMWKAADMPAVGTVNLTLTGFHDNVFSGKVVVKISPVMNAPLFELQKLIMSDPRNIFILYKATGGNPFEMDKVNPTPVAGYKDDPVVVKYYRLIGKISKQNRDFGSTFVQQ